MNKDFVNSLILFICIFIIRVLVGRTATAFIVLGVIIYLIIKKILKK